MNKIEQDEAKRLLWVSLHEPPPRQYVKKIADYIGGIHLSKPLIFSSAWEKLAGQAKECGLAVSFNGASLDSPRDTADTIVCISKSNVVDYMTVHCRTDLDALCEIQAAARESDINLLGVTTLSSEAGKDARYFGGYYKFGKELGLLALEAGFAGVIACNDNLPVISIEARHRKPDFLIAATELHPRGSRNIAWLDSHFTSGWAIASGVNTFIADRTIAEERDLKIQRGDLTEMLDEIVVTSIRHGRSIR